LPFENPDQGNGFGEGERAMQKWEYKIINIRSEKDRKSVV
jgi:hypothetical protein